MDATRYQARVGRALTAALEQAKKQEAQEGVRTLDITRDRLIILSDLKCGSRNRADDVRLCERAYDAARPYDYQRGYTIVSLRDMGELWKERPQAALRAYERSLFLEALFHRAGRLYWRSQSTTRGRHPERPAATEPAGRRHAGQRSKYLSALLAPTDRRSPC